MDTDEPKPTTSRPSTARSRELGEHLRRARHQSRLSSADTAHALGWSLGKLSKLETGTRGTAPWEIGTLLGRYGIDRATRERVMAVATEPDTGSHLRPHIPDADVPLIVAIHERTAQTVTTYEGLTIPPLARTKDYARALTGVPAAATRLERLHPHCVLTIYLHEMALRLPVGTPRTMRDQLLHLTLLGGRPDTALRVVPLGTNLMSALRHSGTLLTFAAPTRPLAYAETDTATVVHDDPQVVDAYETKFQRLADTALDPADTRGVLARYADVYDRQAA